MTLQRLREAIDRVEGRDEAAASGEVGGVDSGWSGIDAVFPGERLPAGVIHEWFGGECGSSALPLLVHLAERVVSGACVWVGRGCWPYPRRLSQHLVRRSVFVQASEPRERAWAVGLCLRCPAVATIVTDGSRFTLAATRKLQLAAQKSRALVLLARPRAELSELSAAAVRWRVEPAPSPASFPRWSVELLRCKGLRPASLPQGWAVEERHGAGVVLVPADVVDRPVPASRPTRLKLA